MKITLLMIATYIVDCIRVGTNPYKVFQLNSKYFNHRRGIFSKIAIDERIPPQWRLPQNYDNSNFTPEIWPVFFKPEWGQNASGVRRADNLEQLISFRQEVTDSNIRYLLQQGADGSREFEVFSIRHDEERDNAAIFTITEALNDAELNPVNSVNNSSTRYVEITQQFNTQQLEKLWAMVNQLGEYNISRASLSADSIEKLLEGKFQVIEVNLFLPMPINLLDQKHSAKSIFDTVRKYMMCLAKVTRDREINAPEKHIFLKVMTYNRKNKLINFLRSKI